MAASRSPSGRLRGSVACFHGGPLLVLDKVQGTRGEQGGRRCFGCAAVCKALASGAGSLLCRRPVNDVSCHVSSRAY